MRTLRADIQVLRAIAVLSVLIFHFELPGLSKGFLGVDIFFVISGYLMSRVIIHELDEGRFSAARFYLRRARRLLPAALAMLLVVTAVVPHVLPHSMLRDYAWQWLGTLTFSANIVLWQQSGYFDGAAALKPLLHAWSLALEEQYYFALPLILYLAGRRWRLATLVLLTLASFAACQWSLGRDPSAAFYLLPTRAWELLIGSLCALPARQGERTGRADSAWLCLPLMALGLLMGFDATHPRGDALLVCLATAGLILWPSRALMSTAPWMRPLHWIGDRSYSLYLVHWPLVALAKSIWLEGVPTHISVALLLASFALAHVSYVLVEQPFRQVDSASALARKLGWLLVPLALASSLMWQAIQTPGERDWAHTLRPNHGFSPACEYDSDFTPRPACADAPQAHTLVWGDSYAMHLIPALTGQADHGGVMQATRSVCSPTLAYARQLASDPPGRGLQCLSFNRSMLAYLAGAPHIQYVVLASRWQYFFDDPVVNAQGQAAQPTRSDLVRSVADVVAQLRQLGKKVIVVSPPALLGPQVDLALCTERRAMGLLTIMASTQADCAFSRREAQAGQGEVRALLTELASTSHVEVVDLADFNCDGDRCVTTIDGTPVYRDFGHLSHEGAQLMGARLHLSERVASGAR